MKKFWRRVVFLYEEFFNEGCANLAASLTFTTLLALVPTMLVGLAILSLFPDFKGMGEQLQHFVISNFVVDSANIISKQLAIFGHQLRQIDWLSFTWLILISMLMIYNMVHAFNRIWHCKMERHLAWAFAIYLLILLLTPLIFGVLMLFSSYLATVPIIEALTKVQTVKTPALIVFPYIATFLMFTFFNWVLPSCRVQFRYALAAGLITFIMFEIAKNSFILYITWMPAYRMVYGTLATIPVFLAWIYLCWVIILLGGIICRIMQCGLKDCEKTRKS